MKFSKSYYRVGKQDYKITSIYTVIFDPHQDVYQIVDDPQGAMPRCVYHGRQCFNLELGQMVQFEELPEPIKKKVATIENRGVIEIPQYA